MSNSARYRTFVRGSGPNVNSSAPNTRSGGGMRQAAQANYNYGTTYGTGTRQPVQHPQSIGPGAQLKQQPQPTQNNVPSGGPGVQLKQQPQPTQNNVPSGMPQKSEPANSVGHPVQPQASVDPVAKSQTEVPQPMETAGAGDTAAAGEGKKKFWMKSEPGVRRKKNKKLMQRRMKKLLTPKTAVMALNELRPGLKYESDVASQAPINMFCLKVEVDGNVYTGVGVSKQAAKAAAAEQALQSFFKPPKPKQQEPTPAEDASGDTPMEDASKEDGKDGTKEEEADETPWSVLASYALHKLFSDWQRRPAGAQAFMPPMGVPGAQFADFYGGRMNEAFSQLYTPFSPPAPVAGASPSPAKSSKKKKAKAKAKSDANKPKELPADAASRNPIQLLNEMRPGLKYACTQENATPPNTCFTFSVTVDDVVYNGQGKSMKAAKNAAAKAAMKALYNVEYPEVLETSSQ